ncbi:MAG: MFS transporter [Microbacterium sp.]
MFDTPSERNFRDDPDDQHPIPQSENRASWTMWTGLSAMALALFMMSTDLTVLFIAQPAITADLRPSAAQALWIVHIGEFLAASLVLTMGRLGDLVGRKRLLLVGIAGYSIASLLAAFAPTPEVLIAARSMLGISMATVTPSAMALLRTMFPQPRQFSTAFALLMMSLSIGAALGPPMGGFLIEHFWWGAVFLVNVPVAVVFLVVGTWVLPEFRDPVRTGLDPASVVLSVIAVLAVVYGLQQSADVGVAVHHVIAVGIGALSGWLFVRRQKRLPRPLLDLELFAPREVRVILAALILIALAFIGPDLLVGPYLQIGLGLSAFQAGLIMSIPAALLIPATLIAPRTGRRLGTARGAAAALMIAVLGFGMAALALLVGTGTDALVLFTIGLSLTAALGTALTLLSDRLIGGAPIQRTGSMTALQDLSSGLGAAFSIAFLGTMGAITYRVTVAVPDGLTRDEAVAAGTSPGAARDIAIHLDAMVQAEFLMRIGEAMRHGLLLSLIVIAAITVGNVALILRGMRTRSGALHDKGELP